MIFYEKEWYRKLQYGIVVVRIFFGDGGGRGWPLVLKENFCFVFFGRVELSCLELETPSIRPPRDGHPLSVVNPDRWAGARGSNRGKEGFHPRLGEGPTAR